MASVALQLALSGAVALAVMMFVIWLLSVRLNNAGLVDVGWSLGLVVLALWYAWQGPGYAPRRWIMAGLVTFWGLRLALHLIRRIASEPEDGRYQQLRREWAGKNINLRFLFFFQFQAVLDVVLSLPMLLAALNPRPELSALEYAGVALWLVAVLGESVADAQLAGFKRDPANRGRVCQVGLWRYSRHPNYFFEWFIWVAWLVYALASPWGWLAVICPALMLFFLFRVTGIPATEAQALRSRGAEYARYQETTSAFVPWWNKATSG
jgi:steroid 5-alpha reductase family enzyme